MRIEIDTDERVTVEDITSKITEAVPDGVERGVCTVFVRHTTAGICVNEHERRLLDDVERALDRLAPSEEGYAHDRIDDNADAHLRAMLLGSSASVPVADGDLDLGTWQSVLFVECDGPQTRTLDVTTTPVP
ncbi:secondary thiamine-phosphate synthase enzyme YjbQ [Halomicroarcula limicola]|uniref:Secondary thiamine-phosphate synthase enzyme YjbQ n=1 Tax=Haloarcula limicola TaxID=1429915 RepID=A0A8J8C5S3_9EURY|nr:secondary thiamine-phosphate synthase enzyme YjbQ [Halomicroarcula limicola]MBV0923053.1 secondary thiamine-phosphate synthase enzyme YjbQ [Halomicroarcula limicola]